jgi:hypothetical protein
MSLSFNHATTHRIANAIQIWIPALLNKPFHVNVKRNNLYPIRQRVKRERRRTNRASHLYLGSTLDDVHFTRHLTTRHLVDSLGKSKRRERGMRGRPLLLLLLRRWRCLLSSCSLRNGVTTSHSSNIVTNGGRSKRRHSTPPTRW